MGLIVHTLLVGDMPFGLRKLEEEVQVRNAVFKSKLNLIRAGAPICRPALGQGCRGSGHHDCSILQH